MDNIYSHFLPILKKAVGSYYKRHRELLLSNAIDNKDLYQEGFIEMDHVLRNELYKHKPLEELRKIVKTAIDRRIREIIYETIKQDEKRVEARPLLELQAKEKSAPYRPVSIPDLLACCSKIDQELLKLRYLDDYKVVEIANMKGRSKGWVSQRIKKAIQIIRETHIRNN